MNPPVHDITSDGKTVWVNSAMGCIGRFGLQGIDIHRPMDEQLTAGQCLHCTHGPVTRAHWDEFVVKMKEFFSIEVPAEFLPKRFRG
jgi:hypothetical protein